MEPNIENLNEAEQAELARLMDKVENGKPNPTSSNPGPTEQEPTPTVTGTVNNPTPTTEDPNREWGKAGEPNPPEVTRVLDPSTWVNKQIDTITSVGRNNYLTGIKHPKKDPIAAGIAAQGKYENKMKDPKVLKRRVENLRKTNMGEWAKMAEELGADKLVDGVVKRRYKIERFVGKFQPLLKAHLAKIDALPDVTDADRENKVLENMRGLKALKGKA